MMMSVKEEIPMRRHPEMSSHDWLRHTENQERNAMWIGGCVGGLIALIISLVVVMLVFGWF